MNDQNTTENTFRQRTGTQRRLTMHMQAAKDQGYEGEELGVFRLRPRQHVPAKHAVHRAKFRRVMRWDK